MPPLLARIGYAFSKIDRIPILLHRKPDAGLILNVVPGSPEQTSRYGVPVDEADFPIPQILQLLIQVGESLSQHFDPLPILQGLDFTQLRKLLDRHRPLSAGNLRGPLPRHHPQALRRE